MLETPTGVEMLETPNGIDALVTPIAPVDTPTGIVKVDTPTGLLTARNVLVLEKIVELVYCWLFVFVSSISTGTGAMLAAPYMWRNAVLPDANTASGTDN